MDNQKNSIIKFKNENWVLDEFTEDGNYQVIGTNFINTGHGKQKSLLEVNLFTFNKEGEPSWNFAESIYLDRDSNKDDLMGGEILQVGYARIKDENHPEWDNLTLLELVNLFKEGKESPIAAYFAEAKIYGLIRHNKAPFPSQYAKEAKAVIAMYGSSFYKINQNFDLSAIYYKMIQEESKPYSKTESLLQQNR